MSTIKRVQLNLTAKHVQHLLQLGMAQIAEVPLESMRNYLHDVPDTSTLDVQHPDPQVVQRLLQWACSTEEQEQVRPKKETSKPPQAPSAGVAAAAGGRWNSLGWDTLHGFLVQRCALPNSNLLLLYGPKGSGRVLAVQACVSAQKLILRNEPRAYKDDRDPDLTADSATLTTHFAGGPVSKVKLQKEGVHLTIGNAGTVSLRYTDEGIDWQWAETKTEPSLSNEEMLDIYTSAESVEELATRYKVPAATILKVLNMYAGLEYLDKKSTPSAKNTGRIDADLAMRVYQAKGKTSQVAAQFGVSNAVVYFIKTGRTWSAVTGHPTHKSAVGSKKKQ